MDTFNSAPTGHMSTPFDDFREAVQLAYYPLEVECNIYNDDNGMAQYFDYHPPFYIEDKCNEMGFGVELLEPTLPLVYPLCCKAESGYHEQAFIIEKKTDWVDKLPYFITWHKDIVTMIHLIRNKEEV